MPSKREGFRIIAYCSLLMIYSTFMVDKAVKIKRGAFSLASYHIGSTVPLTAPVADHLLRPVQVEQDKVADEIKPVHNMEISNDFVSQFEEIFADPDSNANFASLIIKNREVYCRKGQLKRLSRSRYFIQMLQKGLRRHRDNSQHQTHSQLKLLDKLMSNSSNVVPVLIKHDDSNGCYPAQQHDKYLFPRLAWSIPIDNNNNWCAVAGMPSYKAWRDWSKRTKDDKDYWQDTFRANNDEYPWEDKLNKAVWRGATTFNKGLYGNLDFHDIPRVRLVEIARESTLIDAAFHKLVGKYEDESQTPSHIRELLEDSIPLNEMMRYKGESSSNVPQISYVYIPIVIEYFCLLPSNH
jgi:hypothetical protein